MENSSGCFHTTPSRPDVAPSVSLNNGVKIAGLFQSETNGYETLFIIGNATADGNKNPAPHAMSKTL